MPKPRHRRTIEQMIADLEAQRAALLTRAAAKADPSRKHAAAALRSVDKALVAAKDAATREALAEARSALGTILGRDGAVIVPARARRSVSELGELADALLAYVRNNPGQRGEDIAAALGLDTKKMRPVMKWLIADGKVVSEGQRRAMKCAAV